MRDRLKGAAVCALLCLVSTVRAQSGPCTLTLHVDGFRNRKGDLGVLIFKTSEGWPEENGKAFLDSRFSITSTESSAQVSLPPGRYAVVVLHDENLNRKLDRNFLGIPKEGFGFANNPRVMLSAPGFDSAAIDVACPATDVPIHLIYK
jgi:uncharacterized protein (DUF2141 family)